MLVTPKTVGPEVVLQILAPALPESAKFIVPRGAAPPVDPVTVAIKITELPRDGTVDAVRATVGVAELTVVVEVDATAATELYALSPGKVNVAP